MAKSKKKPAKKKPPKRPHPPAKAAKGGKKYIAKAPIRRLMKNEGATLVAKTAVELLIEKLTTIGTDLTKLAIKNVKTDNRKRLTAADINAASRKM